MMNLYAINASANNAFISVAQPRSVTNYFPFWTVCSCFSSAPKVAFISSVCQSFLSLLANVGAGKFFNGSANFKVGFAYRAFSYFFSGSIPSACVVAVHRAKLCIWIACRGVKIFIAMSASLLSSVLLFSWGYANSAFVPSRLSRSFKVAIPTAINFGFSPGKFSGANRANMFDGFHKSSMKASLYRREPKYFDIACKRIEAAYAQMRLFA